MKVDITKEYFERSMLFIQERLDRGPYIFTCIEMAEAMPIELFEAYARTIKDIQRGDHNTRHKGLGMYKRNALDDSEVYLRRMLILEAFKTEVLLTCEFKKEV